ncbi:alanine racemase [Neptuniibacter caesariensis]|uniref:Alanine racemase n=1 Tax=Neptuniibacter caesariensis TaxID=207954 RepID=A0A7U8GTH8_NEPCE|nr:alanine racemase [Neptuniibacter caesariensis]EAR62338.1 alanine racemase [Oceanospirillum sp. MED92] [Neptuniibacter caesariensis]
MARAATATISLEAIRHNYSLAKSVAPDQGALAIIKANAYGHGAVEVAKALSDIADGFGVACIEEAIELREAGIKLPILLLEGFFSADELDYISRENLWCAVHSLAQIDIIAAAKIDTPIKIWLKMDSGMHRLGVAPDDYQEAYQRLNDLTQVKEVVLMTHFSSADEPDLAVTAEQIALFDKVTQGIEADVSLANSAGTMAYPEARRSWQRPGIMLYGATPFAMPQEVADKLKPAMTLSSEVIAVRDLEPGEAVGYSCTWVCDKPTRVGTVAMGYADGYPRYAKSGTPVLVNGQKSQIIGRVSMDMLAVDLTDIPDAEVGSYVEFWGDNLAASEIATYCDTIPYTLFTGITRRVHKKYI